MQPPSTTSYPLAPLRTSPQKKPGLPGIRACSRRAPQQTRCQTVSMPVPGARPVSGKTAGRTVWSVSFTPYPPLPESRGPGPASCDVIIDEGCGAPRTSTEQSLNPMARRNRTRKQGSLRREGMGMRGFSATRHMFSVSRRSGGEACVRVTRLATDCLAYPLTLIHFFFFEIRIFIPRAYNKVQKRTRKIRSMFRSDYFGK